MRQKENNTIHITRFHLDQTDTTRNFYTVVPPTSPLIAYLILLPGFGESAEKVFEQTELPFLAARKGILTIIPTMQDGVSSFGFDDTSQTALHSIVEDAVQRYSLSDKRFFMGGFSMGGTAAVKYTEQASRKPQALFAIDSPLDLERFFQSNHRDITIFHKDKEDDIYVYLERRILEIMGGPPQTAITNYHRISPFSLSDSTQQALKTLTNTHIRIYIEPNPHWWLYERDTDYFGLNIVDCSAFIHQLRNLGNRNANLIITEKKGYRKPDHLYHPHSWGIADANELLDWLLESCHSK